MLHQVGLTFITFVCIQAMNVIFCIPISTICHSFSFALNSFDTYMHAFEHVCENSSSKLMKITWNSKSTISAWFYPTDEDDDDLDYNGSSSSGSDSIVIKIGSKDESSRKLVDNTDASKPSPPLTASSSSSSSDAVSPTERPIVVDSATLAEPNIVGGTSSNVSASTANSNYNYNNENYYSKDDMSVYDDVNNNRLNLRSNGNNNNNNGRSNAYEQRNIYVANNVLSDGTANESIKSYIHIEVYKGNLDEAMTAKPKETKSINAFDVKTTVKSVQLPHFNNGTDRTAEISTTKP